MISNNKEMSFDLVLEYAQNNGISTVESRSVKGCNFAYHRYAVVIGRFAFQVYCHDTGNSVRGYILTDGEDSPYEIISSTFWKRSGYEHNKDKWEKGAWDSKLAEAVRDLKTSVATHKCQKEIVISNQRSILEQSRAYNKAKVESLFD